MSTFLRPLPQSLRDQSLDVLRGFALAGVLLTFCLTNIGAPDNYVNSFWDEAINWPKYLLIENRMINTSNRQLDKFRTSSSAAPAIP